MGRRGGGEGEGRRGKGGLIKSILRVYLEKSYKHPENSKS